jgi:hypothetical protein
MWSRGGQWTPQRLQVLYGQDAKIWVRLSLFPLKRNSSICSRFRVSELGGFAIYLLPDGGSERFLGWYSGPLEED